MKKWKHVQTLKCISTHSLPILQFIDVENRHTSNTSSKNKIKDEKSWCLVVVQKNNDLKKYTDWSKKKMNYKRKHMALLYFPLHMYVLHMELAMLF